MKTLSTLALVTLTLGLAACDSSTDDPGTDTAAIRVVHGSPDAPAVDVYVPSSTSAAAISPPVW